MSKDKDYWSGVAQGTKDGPGGAPFRDAGEALVETLSGGMISRSDAEKGGIQDGREGVHDDD
ncbi:hypothetical protein [Roseovarius phycicola]|uniref:Antitoxin n=1 Tax=Roseovarius phycicola TaxID=3080976 RepID=A0ABZ2HL81_9RHOB